MEVQKKMNDYNLRQLKIMLEKIDRFESGNLVFGNLIEDLEALLNVMEDIDEDWKSVFFSNWLTLEEFYALGLFQKVNPFELDVNGHIPQAIQILKSMIHSELKKHVDDSVVDI